MGSHYAKEERETTRGHSSAFVLKLKIGGVVLLLLLAAVIGALVYRGLFGESKPDITVTGISAKINEVSDLTAAELDYRGLVTYTDGDIPFINQKGFSMIYSAKARAGIDFSKIKIDVTKDKVTVTLPQAQIQSITVASDSIEFYDERFALFNWPNKSDALEAVKAAETDANEQIDTTELIATANLKVKDILQGLLKDSVGDRRLEIVQQ